MPVDPQLKVLEKILKVLKSNEEQLVENAKATERYTKSVISQTADLSKLSTALATLKRSAESTSTGLEKLGRGLGHTGRTGNKVWTIFARLSSGSWAWRLQARVRSVSNVFEMWYKRQDEHLDAQIEQIEMLSSLESAYTTVEDIYKKFKNNMGKDTDIFKGLNRVLGDEKKALKESEKFITTVYKHFNKRIEEQQKSIRVAAGVEKPWYLEYWSNFKTTIFDAGTSWEEFATKMKKGEKVFDIFNVIPEGIHTTVDSLKSVEKGLLKLHGATIAKLPKGFPFPHDSEDYGPDSELMPKSLAKMQEIRGGISSRLSPDRDYKSQLFTGGKYLKKKGGEMKDKLSDIWGWDKGSNAAYGRYGIKGKIGKERDKEKGYFNKKTGRYQSRSGAFMKDKNVRMVDKLRNNPMVKPLTEFAATFQDQLKLGAKALGMDKGDDAAGNKKKDLKMRSRLGKAQLKMAKKMKKIKFEHVTGFFKHAVKLVAGAAMYAAGIALGLLLVIAVIKKAWPLMKKWMGALNKTFGFAKAFMWGIAKVIDGIWNVLSGIWEGDLAKVFKGIFLQILPGIAAIFYGVVGTLIAFIAGVIPVLIHAMLSAAQHIAKTTWKSIKKGFGWKATGGMASGLTVVGERGPELLNLPGGSRVHSNADSKSMMGNTIHVHINGRLGASDAEIRDIANKVARELNLRMNRSQTMTMGV